MQRTRLQVFSFKWNHWLLQQPYSNSAEGAFVCQWNKTQLRKEDIWKLQFQVFIGSQVLVDCNGAVWDLMNVQCPPSKWLQMHSCNIQDHAIGVKANIDPLKSSGFFFFFCWLVTLVAPWATTYYLFILSVLKVQVTQQQFTVIFKGRYVWKSKL